MINNYLDEVLPFLTKISQERREKFYTYFKNAPLWVLASCQVEKVPKGTTFITAGEPVDNIYFIGNGIIKGTDYRIKGVSFDFMVFTDVYAYGGMEVIMDFDVFQASLKTVTDCIILKIPKEDYARWLKSDIVSLGYEAKLMGEYLLAQAKSNRIFLLLQGTDRIVMLFTILYEYNHMPEKFIFPCDRQTLCDYTGLSAKTITRAIQRLQAENLLSKQGGKLIITSLQYNLMKKRLAEIFSDEV